MLLSCQTTQAWFEDGINPKGHSVAFIGFDIRNYENNKYSKELDVQISDGLTIYLLKNEFRVIERKKLDKIVREQQIQLSGIVDEETAVQIGRLASADYLIIGSGSFSISGRSPFIKQLNVKMIDVETGNTSMMSTYHGVAIHLGPSIDFIGKEIMKAGKVLKRE
jgi:hypothetical protein